MIRSVVSSTLPSLVQRGARSRFSSIKIELSEEFYVGEKTHLQIVMDLDKRIQEVVKVLRVVQAND
jgi:hypothetical protein